MPSHHSSASPHAEFVHPEKFQRSSTEINPSRLPKSFRAPTLLRAGIYPKSDSPALYVARFISLMYRQEVGERLSCCSKLLLDNGLKWGSTCFPQRFSACDGCSITSDRRPNSSDSSSRCGLSKITELQYAPSAETPRQATRASHRAPKTHRH